MGNDNTCFAIIALLVGALVGSPLMVLAMRWAQLRETKPPKPKPRRKTPRPARRR